jgi:hypothetical protein
MADPFAVPTANKNTASTTNNNSLSKKSNGKSSSNNTSSRKNNNKSGKNNHLNNNNRKSNQRRKKVAFLFLVRRTLNQLAAWEEFFNGPMGKTHTNIYCHPKDPKVVDVKILREAVIAENVPTAWGTASVTRAILCLLKAALADPDNVKFVLCSESCVPLCTFRELHKDITSHQKSYFDFMSLSDYTNRFLFVTQPRADQDRPKISFSSFKKHATWWILDRKHAQICVTKQKQYLPSFKTVMVPDEHYFATVLWNESQQHDIICKQTTYVNWDANINWFYVKHRFCQRWGLNVLAAGSRLPKANEFVGMYGKLPRKAAKEWKRLCALDQEMHEKKLIAHPITHGADTTLKQLELMYESQAYFARKFSADCNFMKLKMDYQQQKNNSNSNSTAPVININTGKFAIPQYLHSQLFEEMQANLAYLRGSIVEVNLKHAEEQISEQKLMGSDNTSGRGGSGSSNGKKIDADFFDSPLSSTSNTKSLAPDVQKPLIPLSALPPPPNHQVMSNDPVNVAATNQLQNMLGIMVTSDSFVGSH